MIHTSISTRFAARSLFRNPRRTILSIVGMGVATALALLAMGWTQGGAEMYARAAGETAGHLRISPAAWLAERDPELRLADWKGALAAARSHPNTKVATPRARMPGLLAMGTRLASVEVAGVDPATEQAANRFVRTVVAGRYLAPGDRGATVIGKTVAERLKVELDDDLVVTAVRKDGEMESAMLRIVGIVTSGSHDLDATICHVALADVEKLSGRAGASEVAVVLVEQMKLEESRAALAGAIVGGDVVLTWPEVNPELKAGIEMDAGFNLFAIGIVMLVVLLGVASAQLAAVLERRREFAVLTALGLRARHVARAMFVEAAILGVGGALAGLALGVPLLWHLATNGFDIRNMTGGENLEFSGIMTDPIIYADLGLWVVPRALVLCLVASFLATLYPAWFAARTDPADALRVAQ